MTFGLKKGEIQFLLQKAQVLMTRELSYKIAEMPCFVRDFWPITVSPVFGAPKDIPPKRGSKFTSLSSGQFCGKIWKNAIFGKDMDHRMGGGH